MPDMLEGAITAEQLLEIDEPGYHHELIRGELRRMTGPGHWHGAITMRLGTWITQHVLEHGLGMTYAAETGFLLERDPDTVRCPDVAFVRSERVPAAWGRGHLQGAPDLVVEVASPNDSFVYLHDKMLSWVAFGSRLGWLVEPESARVSVYRPGGRIDVLQGDVELDGEGVLPGFVLPLRRLFAPPQG